MGTIKILVLGDRCTDEFVYGRCDRLAPEAPVPVFVETKKETFSGMAGNVFENVKVLIGKDNVYGLFGDDSIKTRYVEEKTNHHIVRIDHSFNENKQIFQDHKPIFDTTVNDFDGIIISDYNKGYLDEKDIKYISQKHPFVFLDTKKKLGKWAEQITFIKINQKEYNDTKHTLSTVPNIEDKLIITLSERACMYQNKIYPVENVEVKNLTGAGDVFMSAFAVGICETKVFTYALKFANKCATQVVQSRGTGLLKTRPEM